MATIIVPIDAGCEGVSVRDDCASMQKERTLKVHLVAANRNRHIHIWVGHINQLKVPSDDALAHVGVEFDDLSGCRVERQVRDANHCRSLT